MERKPELLAPAGSYEIFRAVLRAGADAVYAGAKRFSARANAENFTDAQILRAMDEAHLHGARFYLAVNTLIKDSEMDEALRTVEKFYAGGLDAVIVQDFGLSERLRRSFPDLERHASTQMTVTGRYGIKLLQEYAFTQAVLPRELSIREIRQIAHETDLKLECFIHGALCYCYSGKCLMSSMIGGRSANRGCCAQPCRLPYAAAASVSGFDDTDYVPGRRGAGGGRTGGKKNRGRGATGDRYPLSLKDLCAAQAMAQLLDAGVSSFKIEGRMKGEAYAAGVTAVYRELLDRAFREENLSAEEERKMMARLDALGSRSGFTNGYLMPQRRTSMVSMETSAHRKSHGDDARAQEKTPAAADGDLKIPVSIRARIHRGEALSIMMSAQGHTVTVTGDIVQTAKEQPLTADGITGKLTKLNETPFFCEEIRIDLDEDCFLPVSQLNRLRRQAVSALLQTFRPVRTSFRAESMGPADPLTAAAGSEKISDADTALAEKSGDLPGKNVPLLYVSVVNEAQLRAVLREPETDAVILDDEAFSDAALRGKAVSMVHAAKKTCIFAMPHTFREETARRWESRNDLREADGFLLRCIDEAAFGRTHLNGSFLMADAGLYAWNACSERFLRENGIQAVTVPCELSRREIRAQGAVLTVYGAAELMVSAQCVRWNLTGNCLKEAPASCMSEKMMYLKDRKGKIFPVRQLCGECENVICNCVPTVLFSEGAVIRRMGFSGYRMDFLQETPERIRELYDRYRIFRRGKVPEKEEALFTYGAWKRGTQ